MQECGKKQNRSLAGKVALITGASHGLGRAVALALSRNGAAIAVTDALVEDTQYDVGAMSQYSMQAGYLSQRRDVGYLETAREILALGSKSCAMKMDVDDHAEVKSVVQAVEVKFGAIDILVNNAVVLGKLEKFDGENPDRWNHDLQVNLTGVYNCISAVLPSMMNRRSGRIISIYSMNGFKNAWLQPSYGETGMGIVGQTKALAIEASRYGVTINAICPDLITSEIEDPDHNAMAHHIRKITAPKRMNEPSVVADTVAFLASSHITGAVIPITEGIDLQTL